MSFLPSVLRPHGRDRVTSLEDGMSGDTLQHLHPPARTATMWAPPDPSNQLATFRHMVGIHSTKSMVPEPTNNGKSIMPVEISYTNLHFDGRAAPNLGIYNRVCHRESQAKRSYKFASIFINSCLGVQVVVAAALTAMGAANSNHVGITAFGAINTVIAGLLTYLKGSGLPNRIRWYENEWKRVREYIEQRERDFSRPDCKLDVNEVVEAIEAMYEEVKTNIANNIPDMYIPPSDLRNRQSVAAANQIPKLRHLTTGSGERGRNKLEELELKYGHKVTDFLESLAHKEEERLKKIEGDIESSKARALAALQDEKNNAMKGARDWEKEMEEKGMRTAERELEHARVGVRDWEKDMEDKGAHVAERELEHARSGVLQRGVNFARDLEARKSNLLQRGDSISRDLDAAKAAALQRGRDYEKDVEARTARLAEAERELEREAERTREAAQRAGDSIQRVGDSFQRAGDSMQRIGKAVDDEIKPLRKD